jgi:hypothetical protein
MRLDNQQKFSQRDRVRSLFSTKLKLDILSPLTYEFAIPPVTELVHGF